MLRIVCVKTLDGVIVIEVTRLNNSKFWVNPDMIQFMEETPDTVITLSGDSKIVVKEPISEIIEAVIKYRHRVFTRLPQIVAKESGEE